MGYITKEVGIALGNFISEFVAYEPKNNSDFWKSFMRVRVTLDVKKSLKRGKKIGLTNGIISQVRFKYERLTVVCFFCGLLGHSDTACERLFDLGVDDGNRGWSVDLRVERRRPGSASTCRWLTEEGNSNVNVGAGNMGRNYAAGDGNGVRRDNSVNAGGDGGNGVQVNHALVPHVVSHVMYEGPSLCTMTEVNAVVCVSESMPREQAVCIPRVAVHAQRASRTSLLIQGEASAPVASMDEAEVTHRKRG